MTIKRRDFLRVSIVTIAGLSLQKAFMLLNINDFSEEHTGKIKHIGESSYLIDGWVLPETDFTLLRERG